MANGDDQFGFRAAGAFEPAFVAALRRLRGGEARRRGELEQALATRGVRTSGVAAIPTETLERGAQEAEAGLIGDFALRQAQAGEERERGERAFQQQRQLLREGGEMQEALQRRLARGQLQSALIGGGFGALGGLLSGIGATRGASSLANILRPRPTG